MFVQKFSHDDFIILLLYIDDMLIVGQNQSRIDDLKQQLSKSFEMKKLGPTKQIHGIRIGRDRKAKKLYLYQRFQMGKAKAVSTPLATHFRLSMKQSLY